MDAWYGGEDGMSKSCHFCWTQRALPKTIRLHCLDDLFAIQSLLGGPTDSPSHEWERWSRLLIWTVTIFSITYYWPYPYASYVKITYNKTWPYPDSHYSLISFSILITWMFTITAPSIQLSIHIYMTTPTAVRVNCAKLQNIMDYWFAVLNVQTNSREERRNTIITVVWSVAWQRYHYYPCCMTKKKCCCKIEYLVLWIQFLCQPRLKSLLEDWNHFQAYGDEMARHVLCDKIISLKIEFSKLNAIWCVRKMKSLPVKFNCRKSPRTLRLDYIEAG